MVRIQQIAEPTALTRTRRTKLTRATDLWNDWQAAAVGSTASKSKREKLDRCLNKGYAVVKDELTRLQHGKCAYCERWASGRNGQIDHFRPRRPIESGWWWLNWSWDNLLIACGGCNGEKSERSPLIVTALASAQPTPPTTVAVLEAWTPQGEGHTILHPRLEDPAGALSWVLLNPSADPDDWKVLVNGASPRGEATRERVKLDQHLDDVATHLRQFVGPVFQQLRSRSRLVRDGRLDHAELNARWAEMLRVTLREPRAQFRAATASVLTQLWFHDNLGPAGLDLPAPSLSFP